MTDAPVIKGPGSIQIFPLRLVVDAVQLHLHLWNPTTIHHNFDHGSRHRARSFNNDAISFRRFLVAATNKQITHVPENKIWRFEDFRQKLGYRYNPRALVLFVYTSLRKAILSLGKLKYSTKLLNFVEIIFNEIIISHCFLRVSVCTIVPFRYFSRERKWSFDGL